LRTILSIFILSTLSLSLFAGDIYDPWRRAGLDFSYVRKLISNDNCNISVVERAGCVYAINRMLAAKTPMEAIVPAGASTKPSVSAQIKKINNALKLDGVDLVIRVDLPTDSEKLALTVENTFERSALALWKQNKNLNPDWNEILKYIEKTIPLNKVEIPLAVLAIDSYLAATMYEPSYIKPTPDMMESTVPTGDIDDSAGFGFTIVKHKLGYAITDIRQGSGGEDADLWIYDIITAIDGVQLNKLKKFSEVSALFKGKEGTTASVTYLRNGKSENATVTRKKLSTAPVEAAVLKDNYGRTIGYIKLRTFDSMTSCQDVALSLLALQEEMASGLILDLRGNGGGMVAQAACIASLFLVKGAPIVSFYNVHTSQKSGEIAATLDGNTRLPLVVLIDEGSASASELLSMALA